MRRPLLIALSTVCGALPARAAEWSGLADAADAFSRIAEFLSGIQSFLAGIAFISETIGYATIFLFLTVILFSAGLTAMGVPKGKPSFFASLAAADLIWALWNVSLQASFPEYIGPMVKSNLILLAPAAAVAITVRFFPLLASRARRAASGLFRKKKRLARHDAAALLGEFQERSSGFSASLLADILASGDEPVRLSEDTAERARALGDLLERLANRDRS